jgi:hypothetical protein
MITSFNEETCALIGIRKADAHQANAFIQNERGSVAVIENASVLIR